MDTIHSNTAICAVFWLLLVVSTTSGALLKGPKDYNVTAGQNVTLECKTDLDLPVYWYFNNHEIFYGGKVSMSFQDMFKVTSNEQGGYNLEITAADESYIGEYICGDDEGQGERRSARLYVTAPVTESINASSDNVDNTSIIGIVVGVVAGIALLAITTAVGVYFWKKRSKNGKKRDVGEKVHPKSEEKENLVTAGEQSTETYVGKKIYEEKAIKLREGNAEDPAEALPKEGHVKDTIRLFEPETNKNKNPTKMEEFKQKNYEEIPEVQGNQKKTTKQKPSFALCCGKGEKPVVYSSGVPSSTGDKQQKEPNMQFIVSKPTDGGTAVGCSEAGSPADGAKQNAQNTASFTTSNSTEGDVIVGSSSVYYPDSGLEENAPNTTPSTDSKPTEGDPGMGSTAPGSSVFGKEQNIPTKTFAVSNTTGEDVTVGSTPATTRYPGMGYTVAGNFGNGTKETAPTKGSFTVPNSTLGDATVGSAAANSSDEGREENESNKPSSTDSKPTYRDPKMSSIAVISSPNGKWQNTSSTKPKPTNGDTGASSTYAGFHVGRKEGNVHHPALSNMSEQTHKTSEVASPGNKGVQDNQQKGQRPELKPKPSVIRSSSAWPSVTSDEKQNEPNIQSFTHSKSTDGDSGIGSTAAGSVVGTEQNDARNTAQFTDSKRTDEDSGIGSTAGGSSTGGTGQNTPSTASKPANEDPEVSSSEDGLPVGGTEENSPHPTPSIMSEPKQKSNEAVSPGNQDD